MKVEIIKTSSEAITYKVGSAVIEVMPEGEGQYAISEMENGAWNHAMTVQARGCRDALNQYLS